MDKLKLLSAKSHSIEKYIALILIPTSLCKSERDFQTDLSYVKNLFINKSNIDDNEIKKELKDLMSTLHIHFPQKSKELFFTSCYYKNDQDKKKILKQLSLTLHYVNKIETELVDPTAIYKAINPMLNFVNTSMLDSVTSLTDILAYSKGCNPFKGEERNFSESLIKKISVLKESNKQDFLNKSSLDDYNNLRSGLSYAIYTSINNRESYLNDLFNYSYLFKNALIQSSLDSYPLVDIEDIENNPHKEIIPFLNNMISITQLKNPLDTDNPTVQKQQKTELHNSDILELFKNLSMGYLFYQGKVNNRITRDDLASLPDLLNNFNNTLLKLNMPVASAGDIEYTINSRENKFNKMLENAILKQQPLLKKNKI